MPAVVTFWQLPQDEKAILDFLLSTGKIVALPDHWVKTKEELAPQPIVQYIQQRDPVQLLFGLERYAQQATIEPQEQNGERFLSVAYMSPCLIAYSRGKFRDGNKLGQSNLHAYWNYPNENATALLDKDPEFIKWAKKVLGWVRKFTPEKLECNGYPYRATTRVKDAVQNGQLEVVLY